MSGQRKSLGVLQRPCAVSLPSEPIKSAMVRGDENAHSVFKSKSTSHQSLVIYEDPRGLAPAKHDIETQTGCNAMQSSESQTDCTGCYSCSRNSVTVCRESSHNSLLDIKLLTQEEPPAEYWAILAEQRREALEDALKENEKIHGECNKLLTEMKELRVEMNQLQDDNAQLLELAGEAEYFANMLKKITNEAEVKNDESCSSKKDEEEADVLRKTLSKNGDEETGVVAMNSLLGDEEADVLVKN